jgi:hypothetical protein
MADTQESQVVWRISASAGQALSEADKVIAKESQLQAAFRRTEAAQAKANTAAEQIAQARLRLSSAIASGEIKGIKQAEKAIETATAAYLKAQKQKEAAAKRVSDIEAKEAEKVAKAEARAEEAAARQRAAVIEALRKQRGKALYENWKEEQAQIKAREKAEKEQLARQAQMQERARESLQRQRSQSLYSNWLDEQRKKQRALAEEAGGSAAMIRSTWGALTGFLGAFGVSAGLTGFIEHMKGLDQTLASMAENSNRAASGLVSLAALQAPGQAQRVTKEIAALGVEYGSKPSETAPIAQLLQSLSGSKEQAKKDLVVALQLKRLGVQDQNVQDLSNVVLSRGLTLQQGAAGIYRAAQLSPLEPSDIVQAAPSISGYKDPRVGIAAITAMAAEGIPRMQLQDATKDLPLALQLDSDLVKKTTGRLAASGIDYQNLGEIEQLRALKQDIVDKDKNGKLTIAEVMQSGINERQAARSIAAAINQLPKLEQTYAEVLSAPADLLAQEIDRMKKEMPQIVAAWRDQDTAAFLEYNDLYGPQSEEARKRKENLQTRGVQAAASGNRYYVEDNGELGMAARFFEWIARKIAASGGQMSPYSASGPSVDYSAIQNSVDTKRPTESAIKEALKESMKSEGKQKAERKASGGKVQWDGPVVVHRGEEIIPEHVVRKKESLQRHASGVYDANEEEATEGKKKPPFIPSARGRAARPTRENTERQLSAMSENAKPGADPGMFVAKQPEGAMLAISKGVTLKPEHYRERTPSRRGKSLGLRSGEIHVQEHDIPMRNSRDASTALRKALQPSMTPAEIAHQNAMFEAHNNAVRSRAAMRRGFLGTGQPSPFFTGANPVAPNPSASSPSRIAEKKRETDLRKQQEAWDNYPTELAGVVQGSLKEIGEGRNVEQNRARIRQAGANLEEYERRKEALEAKDPNSDAMLAALKNIERNTAEAARNSAQPSQPQAVASGYRAPAPSPTQRYRNQGLE